MKMYFALKQPQILNLLLYIPLVDLQSQLKICRLHFDFNSRVKRLPSNCGICSGWFNVYFCGVSPVCSRNEP